MQPWGNHRLGVPGSSGSCWHARLDVDARGQLRSRNWRPSIDNIVTACRERAKSCGDVPQALCGWFASTTTFLSCRQPKRPHRCGAEKLSLFSVVGRLNMDRFSFTRYRASDPSDLPFPIIRRARDVARLLGRHVANLWIFASGLNVRIEPATTFSGLPSQQASPASFLLLRQNARPRRTSKPEA